MLSLPRQLCGGLLWGLLGSVLLQSAPKADDKNLHLGEQRLFMTSAQRQNIERQALGNDMRPGTDLFVAPVVEKKEKLQKFKFTLKGAVVRPDGSAVLLVNNETRKIPRKQVHQSGEYSFSVSMKRSPVRLKPGQSVWVIAERE